MARIIRRPNAITGFWEEHVVNAEGIEIKVLIAQEKEQLLMVEEDKMCYERLSRSINSDVTGNVIEVEDEIDYSSDAYSDVTGKVIEVQDEIDYSSDAYIINCIWNAISDAKKQWLKQGINHTEEQYRNLAEDLKDRMDAKNNDIAALVVSYKRQFESMNIAEIEMKADCDNRLKEKRNEIKRLLEDNRELKRVADKCLQYKDHYEKLAKKIRKIEDYVSREDHWCRTYISTEEYMTTDESLKMFYKIEL